ncbi:hypothetical protein V8F20_006427 [Naviculisporaceae sp. PSN 640]
MFYEPGKNNHGLPHDPFKACVIPRPIGWISTVSLAPSNQSGSASSTGSGAGPKYRHNLAPYSQFNNLTFDPPYIMFSANQQPDPLVPGGSMQKDTAKNVEATGVFVWNLATWDLREAVNATAQQFASGVDEFEKAGLEKEYSQIVSVSSPDGSGKRIPVPMVKASPVKFECEYYTTLRLPGNGPVGAADVIIGRVVGVHIADWALTDGKLDVRKTMPIARLGYYQYTVVKETFDMIIPGMDEMMLAGLEGNKKRVDEAAKTRGKEEAKL